MLKTLAIVICGSALSAAFVLSPTWAQDSTAATDPVVTVHMNGSSFAPDSAHVKAGATVRFNNDDQIPHNVTGSVKDVVSGDIAPGKTWSYTFKQAGDYRYSCTYHPWMKGEVFVAAGK